MTDKQPNEVIEVIVYPDGHIELSKFINSMSAINRDYRRWLIEHNENPYDADLKLYVERVEHGSIKLWLAKIKDISTPLSAYGSNFFQKIKSAKNSAAQWTHNELQNKHNYLNNNRGNSLEANFMKREVGGTFNFINYGKIIVSSDDIEKSRAITADLLAKQKETYPDISIRFIRYDLDSNAKIIAERIDPEVHIAYLSDSVRSRLHEERENLFKKRYIANVTVRRISGSNKIEAYVINSITAS